MSDQRVGHALRDTGHIHAESPMGGMITGVDLNAILGATMHMSCIIGVVDLVDGHYAHDGCCDDPWADQGQYKMLDHIVHLKLENPRPCLFPVRTPGRLGLWTVPADVEAAMTMKDGAAQ